MNEFWRDQKHIVILDPNILACKQRIDLLKQLRDSGAWIEFNQGLDARFITEDVALILKDIKKEKVHFAFDLMDNEKAITKGLKIYSEIVGSVSNVSVYMLTNYNTTHEQDIYRLNTIKKYGFLPDVRIYRKPTAPKITRDLQHWCNNRFLYKSCEWEDFVPRSDGKTIRELYYS